MSADSTRRNEGLSDRTRAVIVGVQLPGVSDLEHETSLLELERLATTLGLAPIARVTQRRDALAPSTVLGDGKLRELAKLTGGRGFVPSGAKRKKRRIDEDEREDDEASASEGAGDDDSSEAVEGAVPEAERASVVLVDHDLGPSQARNLEKALGAEVLDRTSVILAIFQRHARTREAKLQVEIARLGYDAPRLREQGGGADRQRGGIGGKGAGESSLELDRRRIRDRIAELKIELAKVQSEDAVRRARRTERGDTVALIGYTNAGKSSWFRRLTSGDVYVADKLFATLDTTVRRLAPETRPAVLVSDTVGFIQRLPHDLVASFRSTLEEARDASLLVFVVDASDPAFRDQLRVTREVLADIDVGSRASLVLLNKIDRVAAEDREALMVEMPEALLVSARDDESVALVRERIVTFFEASMEEREIFVPWAEQARVHRAHEEARVLEEIHDEEGTRLRLRAPAAVLSRLASR